MSPNASANLIYSQSLWDAAMANAVANYLSRNKGALVVQLNGGFHTESRLGTIEAIGELSSQNTLTGRHNAIC